jgi:uncharacterized protein DUF5666
MRVRHCVLLLATGVLVSSLASTALAQTTPSGPSTTKTPISVTELFSKAKPGMWVRLEGVPQPDQTIQCTKARLISGAVDEDDWTIKGQIRSVEPASRQLTVGSRRVRIQTTPAPKFTPVTTLHGIPDLKVGMYVKVTGTYTAEGFVARKVDDQSADVAQKVGADKKVQNQGKVERVDPTRKAIVLMGTTYVLSPDTKATAVVQM